MILKLFAQQTNNPGIFLLTPTLVLESEEIPIAKSWVLWLAWGRWSIGIGLMKKK